MLDKWLAETYVQSTCEQIPRENEQIAWSRIVHNTECIIKWLLKDHTV